uniref:Uncharacterized protein n=1 Tax=Eutreptiella gymnastica TaxID=73025 RepID=A0A6T1YAI2_9EUGL|mmetsp:Transcript_7713/g.14818  ORF Transcript_7713/g.14818 Transcript_7713/m.14818 type:complete len:138 (-) Transcript_7713:475-888(-)
MFFSMQSQAWFMEQCEMHLGVIAFTLSASASQQFLTTRCQMCVPLLGFFPHMHIPPHMCRHTDIIHMSVFVMQYVQQQVATSCCRSDHFFLELPGARLANPMQAVCGISIGLWCPDAQLSCWLRVALGMAWFVSWCL